MSAFQPPLRSGRIVSVYRSSGHKDIVLVKGIISERSSAGYFYLHLEPTKKLLFDIETADVLSNSGDSKRKRDIKMFLRIFFGIQTHLGGEMDSASLIDLRRYGSVILSGYGAEPSLEAKKYVKEKFGFE